MKVMSTRKTFLLAAFAALIVTFPSVLRADDLKSVLAQLDNAAAKFKSTSADFQFDTVQTDPIPDKDVQSGKVYYERAGTGFSMGVHIEQINGRPVPKVIVVAGGVFKMYEKMLDQVTTSSKVSKYESYLELGFGASGRDLQQKWNISYAGSETINGIKTEKLDLVAKDPEVLKLFPRVTIWIDPERGVSLKQYFDEGEGQSRTCLYSNIKVNATLPPDAFKFATDSKTQYVTR